MTTNNPTPQDALDAAGKALDDFVKGPVVNATTAIETAVTSSFDSIASTIARAVVSGKESIDQLTDAILADFDRVATRQFIVKPIESLIGSIASSILPIGGARAAGGPVSAGVPYLVGEQGPELFTPDQSGSIASNASLASQRPQIVLNVQARDAGSFLKSESQIAAMLSRALARGQRNL